MDYTDHKAAIREINKNHAHDETTRRKLTTLLMAEATIDTIVDIKENTPYGDELFGDSCLEYYQGMRQRIANSRKKVLYEEPPRPEQS
ncbi:hypothetical protein HN747_03925 [archaeon]|jgi:hypothetical protein|nr:hypothetical protein [archaeon]